MTDSPISTKSKNEQKWFNEQNNTFYRKYMKNYASLYDKGSNA